MSGAASLCRPPFLWRRQALDGIIRPDQPAIREFAGSQSKIMPVAGQCRTEALRLEVQQLGKLFGCNTHFDELQSIRVGGMEWISTQQRKSGVQTKTSKIDTLIRHRKSAGTCPALFRGLRNQNPLAPSQRRLHQGRPVNRSRQTPNWRPFLAKYFR